MPAVDYVYAPVYGVENYRAPGNGVAGNGGAEETNDNLLVTLWEADLAVEPPLPNELFGDIIVPFYANEGGAPPPNTAPAYRQGMKSRVSTRFFFFANEAVLNAPAGIAVLNPPQEYKQQLVGAVERIGDVPPGAFLPPTTADFLKINRPLEGVNAWDVNFVVNPTIPFVNFLLGSDDATVADTFVGYVYSSIFTFSPDGLTAPLGIPFLKTSGADGNKPTFFDPSTNSGFDEMIDAINRGDFYVCMIFFGDPWAADDEEDIAVPGQITLTWPHSIGRG